MYSDAHLHILDAIKRSQIEKPNNPKAYYDDIFMSDVYFCASAETKSVFEEQESICKAHSQSFILSFGIHPQRPFKREVLFLEQLIKEKRIKAIGECGFDLFSKEFKDFEKQQSEIWNIQLELAIENSLPMIIHCRKALDLIFKDIAKIKKLPSIIFHGWAGSYVEANSFLKKGVNAYFCIGKGLLRGQKAQIETGKKLELSHLLTETDAPYMSLKDQDFSLPVDIKQISSSLADLRAINGHSDIESFYLQIYENFKNSYFL